MIIYTKRQEFLCPREDWNADEAQLISIPTWHYRRDFHFSGIFSMNFLILSFERFFNFCSRMTAWLLEFFLVIHTKIRSVWRWGLFKPIVVSCQAIVQILGLANVKFVKSFGIQDVDKIIQGKLSLLGMLTKRSLSASRHGTAIVGTSTLAVLFDEFFDLSLDRFFNFCSRMTAWLLEFFLVIHTKV